ncbi:uncharacterized protein METZ01_LOCUS490253, partial [marine metagenome]
MKKLLLLLVILFSSFETFASSYVGCEVSNDQKDWKTQKNMFSK